MSVETRAAEIVMPVPTPAKWTAESSDRPAAARRSRMSAEAKTSPKALATPPTKRRTRNAAGDDVRPIAAVVAALTASAMMSHRRREPATNGVAASRAPVR